MHELIKRCETSGATKSGASINDIFSVFDEYFIDRAPLLSLSKEHPNLAYELGSSEFESRFDELFALGPGGLDILTDSLECIYQLLHVPLDDESFQDQAALYQKADDVSLNLTMLVEHIRKKYSRHHWDPKGFRQFGARYDVLRHHLLV